jgi:hypothetical protein
MALHLESDFGKMIHRRRNPPLTGYGTNADKRIRFFLGRGPQVNGDFGMSSERSSAGTPKFAAKERGSECRMQFGIRGSIAVS